MSVRTIYAGKSAVRVSSGAVKEGQSMWTLEASGSQISKCSQAEMASSVVSFGMVVEFVVVPGCRSRRWLLSSSGESVNKMLARSQHCPDAKFRLAKKKQRLRIQYFCNTSSNLPLSSSFLSRIDASLLLFNTTTMRMYLGIA
jgi:hypothetical protein